MLEKKYPAKSGRVKDKTKEGKATKTTPRRNRWKEVETEKRAEEGPKLNIAKENHRRTKKVPRPKPLTENPTEEEEYGPPRRKDPPEERRKRKREAESDQRRGVKKACAGQ